MNTASRIGVGLVTGALAFGASKEAAKLAGFSERAIEANATSALCTGQIASYAVNGQVKNKVCFEDGTGKKFRVALRAVDSTKRTLAADEFNDEIKATQAEYKAQTHRTQESVEEIQSGETWFAGLVGAIGLFGGIQGAPKWRKRWPGHVSRRQVATVLTTTVAVGASGALFGVGVAETIANRPNVPAKTSVPAGELASATNQNGMNGLVNGEGRPVNSVKETSHATSDVSDLRARGLIVGGALSLGIGFIFGMGLAQPRQARFGEELSSTSTEAVSATVGLGYATTSLCDRNPTSPDEVSTAIGLTIAA